MNTHLRSKAILLAILMVIPFARLLPARVQQGAHPQAGEQANPTGALIAALVAACRQTESGFATYLTAENAKAFRALPEKERTGILRRFSLIDDPGRPLISSDPQNHAVVRCEASRVTVEFRFGVERVQENLAFIPVQVVDGRAIEFGMVHEGGGWRLLSLGLLLLNIPELSKLWAEQALDGSERTAIATLHRLADAIATYRRAYGNLPESLNQLGPAPKDGVSPDAAQLVDADLAGGEREGYRFRYRIAPAPDDGEQRFELAAQPIEYGQTGRRSFYLDAQGKLRGADHQGAVATADDPELPSENSE